MDHSRLSMPLGEAIFSQRSIRRFKPDAIPLEDVGFHFCLPLGYPQGNFGPNVRKPTSETTFLNRWSAPVPWK